METRHEIILDNIIDEKYSPEQLIYIGTIICYFSLIDFALFRFLRRNLEVDEDKDLACKNFEILKQRLHTEITDNILYKQNSTIKKIYNKLKKKLDSVQVERNKFAHSVFTRSQKNTDHNIMYNRKSIAIKGFNSLVKRELTPLRDFSIEVINFWKELDLFLMNFQRDDAINRQMNN